MSEENFFASPWDNLVKGVTISVFILLVFLIVIFIIIADNFLFIIGIILLYSSVLFLPYLWAPLGYIIINHDVIVKRLIGEVRFRVVGEPKRWKWTWWGIRLFGSGGLYGYFGFFTFKGIGRVRMYSTNRHNLVLVKDDKNRRILLSPKEPDKFIRQLSD